jgi:hypothetical protein
MSSSWVCRMAGVAAVVVTLGMGVVSPASADDGAVGVGPAHLTTPDQTSTITSGASKSLFTVAVPPGGKCRQDSTQGTVLYSFLVPEGTDIASVTYHGDFPSVGYFLVDPNGTPMYGIAVARATAAIYNIPTFAWIGLLLTHVPLHGQGGLLDPASPHPGVWEGGVACTLAGHIQDYWKFQVTFFAKGASDFTWSTRGSRPTSSGGVPTIGVVVIVVVFAVAGGVGIEAVRRRRAAVAGATRRAA